MIALVLLIGTDHPPTRDDTVKLGWFRTILGYASLLIPSSASCPICSSKHAYARPGSLARRLISSSSRWMAC